jgi:hypothetical protein
MPVCLDEPRCGISRQLFTKPGTVFGELCHDDLLILPIKL